MERVEPHSGHVASDCWPSSALVRGWSSGQTQQVLRPLLSEKRPRLRCLCFLVTKVEPDPSLNSCLFKETGTEAQREGNAVFQRWALR